MIRIAQLHGALERETSRRIIDISTEIEFDASLTTYIGTANSTHGLGLPILSRMQVFSIDPPDSREAIKIAASVVRTTLKRVRLEGQVKFTPRAICLLAHLTPRAMTRAVEQSIAAAVAEGREVVVEHWLWNRIEGSRRALMH